MFTSKLVVTWKQWAERLKVEVYALYLAYKDPRVPWYARMLAACVVAYAFSPIDLIPDFVPVLGYLDDLLLVPFGITIAIKMIPAEVLQAHRERSLEIMQQGKPVNKAAAAVIILIWMCLAIFSIVYLQSLIKR